MQEIYYAKTHADFLNQAFYTKYKAWMKSRWDLSSDTWVWMVRFDGIARDGWINKIINESEIWEEYIGKESPSYANEYERRYRIVVKIDDYDKHRTYRILGKYKYDELKSTINKHVLIKVD